MKKVLSLLFAFSLLLTCGLGQAIAELPINNQIKGDGGDTVVVDSAPRQESGLELILSTGDQYQITMPSYFAYITPAFMYVTAPGGHSIYVYRDFDLDKEKLMPFAYEGARVTAVAEQSNGTTNLTCIVYRDENYRLRAGWVHSKYLTLWFPGPVATIGSSYTGTVYTAGDPVLSWAKDYFVNTRQKYTLLSEPIPACTQFQLNYQVTSRNGSQTSEVLGPRTVYVNDGSGWIMVGQFPYDEIKSVLVTVNLPEPTDLRAVAVIPSCARPDRFVFRQAVQDVLSTDPNVAYSGGSGKPGGGTPGLFPSPAPVGPGSGVPGPGVPGPGTYTLRKGSIITFGSYEQDNYRTGGREPIEWIVLEVQDTKVFLVSRYGLDCVSYCSSKDTVAWETSKVRAWLNDQFLNYAFTPEEQRAILFTEVDNSKSQGYIHYDRDGGNNTWDQIFLLSYAEAWKYFFQNSDRACKPTNVAVKRGVFKSDTSGNCPWWLRSPGYTTDYVACVDVDGNRGGNIKYGATAVRPAMWIEKSAIPYYWNN